MIFPLIITSMSNWCSLNTLKSPIYPIHIHFRLPKASRWLEEEAPAKGDEAPAEGKVPGAHMNQSWPMFFLGPCLFLWYSFEKQHILMWYLSRFCILLGFGENKMALICLVMSCILSIHNHKFGAQTPWQVAQVPAAVGDPTGDCISGQ